MATLLYLGSKNTYFSYHFIAAVSVVFICRCTAPMPLSNGFQYGCHVAGASYTLSYASSWVACVSAEIETPLTRLYALLTRLYALLQGLHSSLTRLYALHQWLHACLRRLKRRLHGCMRCFSGCMHVFGD
ncbi:hypothetical protein [Flavobacterium sp.]|uniref:hypothetical protein n=1 Tax=Flavobacterium sp. TaxID=239 RepID=UPI0026158239|nr:hypothetical protein [Flavobacterium sp.]